MRLVDLVAVSNIHCYRIFIILAADMFEKRLSYANKIIDRAIRSIKFMTGLRLYSTILCYTQKIYVNAVETRF